MKNFTEMTPVGPEEPPFFAILLKKMGEVESRLGTCTEHIEADLPTSRRIEGLATGNEIYEPTDMSEMVLLRLNCIFDILTRLEYAQAHLKTIV